jgi:acetyl esterase
VTALAVGSAKLLEKANRYPGLSFDKLGIDRARQAFAISVGIVDIKAVALVLVDDWVVELEGRALKLRRYAHQLTPIDQPVMLYFHGGGFNIGSIETHDRLCRSLAALSGVMVLSLDYRLAPEHQFPAAYDDAFETFQWVHEHALQLGVNPARIAVGGDSAGGTLAAAVAIAAKELGLPLAMQLLLYPGLASAATSQSHLDFAQGHLLDASTIQWFFDNYFPPGADRNDWRFAPLVYPSLEGLAPTWMAIASHDPLRDEDMQYAQRLKEAGCEITSVVYAGLLHNFMMQAGLIPEALQAHSDVAEALKNGTR